MGPVFPLLPAALDSDVRVGPGESCESINVGLRPPCQTRRLPRLPHGVGQAAEAGRGQSSEWYAPDAELMFPRFC